MIPPSSAEIYWFRRFHDHFFLSPKWVHRQSYGILRNIDGMYDDCHDDDDDDDDNDNDNDDDDDDDDDNEDDDCDDDNS